MEDAGEVPRASKTEELEVAIRLFCVVSHVCCLILYCRKQYHNIKGHIICIRAQNFYYNMLSKSFRQVGPDQSLCHC